MEPTTVECTVCNDKQDRWKITRTTDGKIICMRCYNIAASALGTGQICSSDAKYVREFLKGYNEQIDLVLLAIRRIAQQEKTSEYKVMDQYLELEAMMAEKHFNKTRGCLNNQEHSHILAKLLHTVFAQHTLGVKGNQEGRPKSGSTLERVGEGDARTLRFKEAYMKRLKQNTLPRTELEILA